MAVTQIKGSLVPLSEMLTVKHASSNVSSWLLLLFSYLSKFTSKKFDVVVTDESLALMMAVSLGINSMTVKSVIKAAFNDCLTGSNSRSVVGMALCQVHVLRTFFRHLPKNPQSRNENYLSSSNCACFKMNATY